ncbi:hypothetical protein G6F62_013585 [Rhizopus arrhizus]|nr:hypothetical protein G6F62_013585 [Rhizopus arrhizus]
MVATPPGESHGAAGAAGAAQCSDFDGRRLYVHGRLLRPAIRDKPVSAAAAGPLGAGNRRGLPADDVDWACADAVQCAPGTALQRADDDREWSSEHGSRVGGGGAASAHRARVVDRRADGAGRLGRSIRRPAGDGRAVV